jgi:hypothetical protein
MTDRVNTLTVVLDREIRVDDVEAIKAAISMVRFVSKVENGPVNDVDTYVAYDRVRREIKEQLFKVLSPDNYEAFKKAGVFD